ncbi:TonB-dependent receptor [Sandaracinobacteroides saxicola]|uniref:TonB-dependent receptor n=1 Tax=Sandaracinobacteroides saxicola TaxID=2759707 RepID=A0A7G5IDP5_9SPHN|nr:TonB-dependent receptor [Sandaracinobacteroides saxicola]QMW21487.1 TonB-dependent receptor [Sandaracinobacteroides saxicola]
MRHSILLFVAVACLFTGEPVAAQQAEEIIVTASRREEAAPPPLVGVRRVADFAVLAVTVTSDSRDSKLRYDEIFGMVRKAIELAGKRGVELSTGELKVEPLTLANYRDLPVSGAGRADTSRVGFLLKTRLAGATDAKSAVERLEAFVKSVPLVGRAEMVADDDLALTVVEPGQYRGAILERVVADAKAQAARMGEGYAVELEGLDRRVEFERVGLTEVMLFVRYGYRVVPSRR